MDMDSTLITIECIDEIADIIGKKDEISSITSAAMNGALDFKESLKRRVEILKGITVDSLQRVINERLRFSIGAEQLINTLKSHSIYLVLVSGGFTFFSDFVKDKLSLDESISNTLEIVDGVLTGRVLGDIVDANIKKQTLIRVREKLGLNRDQVVAIGDGANDLLMMEESAVSIAYHAKQIVKEKATYSLNYAGLDGVLHLLGHY